MDAIDLVAELRKFGSEAARVEVKAASGGLPSSCRESLSALANSPGGGTLILGLAESEGFAAVGLANPAKIMSDLGDMCSDALVPPLRPIIELAEIDGRPIVLATVHELPREQKPCYVQSLGLSRGTYLRVGESDRRLTPEEVQQLVAERGQPVFDAELVEAATPDDLDPGALADFTRRLRDGSPRLWAAESDETILRMTRVLVVGPAGHLHPSLAAYLALGRYPQQLFPQLNVTFVHYPTVSGEATPSGVRFLDNVRIDGPIPLMAQEAMAAVQRNMTRRSFVAGGGRRDIWEYPPEALREAIVNALVHRDLSPGSRGTQVQIEMYPDRLRIHNPGGLFGSIDIDRLGEEGRSSARNSLLMKLLEDISAPGEDRTVCENRGSGVRAMIASLRHAGMSPPRFRDRVTAFEVVMPNHALLDDDTVEWLNHLGREGLRDSQCIALALMRRDEVLDNARYRAVTGVTDSRVATFELQDLVARELVDQDGVKGGARYGLSESARNALHDGRRLRPNRRLQIIQALELRGALSKSQLVDLVSAGDKTVEHWLRELKKSGDVEIAEGGRSVKTTTYRLTPKPLQPDLPLPGAATD
jgi:ATP-dependent DNA helicase RecG